MIRLKFARLTCFRMDFSYIDFAYSCMQNVDYFREYIYIFYQKDVTRILSVFCWDVSRSEFEVYPNPKYFLELVVLLKNIDKLQRDFDVRNVQGK